MRKRSSSNGVTWSVCVHDTGEACRNLRPPEREIPSRSGTMQSEEPLSREESPFAWIWVFLGGTFLIIPHMHTFTVQDAQFVISFSKVQRSNMPRPRRGERERGDWPQSYIARNLLLQSVVSHCRFLLTRKVFDGLSLKKKKKNYILKT